MLLAGAAAFMKKAGVRITHAAAGFQTKGQ
jgi:hypothetical protein